MPITTRSSSQLGSIIRRKRRRIGLTQAQLAEKLGVRQATVSGLENGQDGAAISLVLATLAALDLDLTVADRTAAPDIEDIF